MEYAVEINWVHSESVCTRVMLAGHFEGLFVNYIVFP